VAVLAVVAALAAVLREAAKPSANKLQQGSAAAIRAPKRSVASVSREVASGPASPAAIGPGASGAPSTPSPSESGSEPGAPPGVFGPGRSYGHGIRGRSHWQDYAGGFGDGHYGGGDGGQQGDGGGDGGGGD
jgi:hypothetical protein